MLQTGTKAPSFSSPDQHNQLVSLDDFTSKKNVVLYFYPKDDTPGCTIQANDFTALANDFNELDTEIIGVSKDDCASHLAFIDKFKLNLVLLADTTGEVCDSYDVWQQKEKDGIKKKWEYCAPPLLLIKVANLVTRNTTFPPMVMLQKYSHLLKNSCKGADHV